MCFALVCSKKSCFSKWDCRFECVKVVCLNVLVYENGLDDIVSLLYTRAHHYMHSG